MKLYLVASGDLLQSHFLFIVSIACSSRICTRALDLSGKCSFVRYLVMMSPGSLPLRGVISCSLGEPKRHLMCLVISPAWYCVL